MNTAVFSDLIVTQIIDIHRVNFISPGCIHHRKNRRYNAIYLKLTGQTIYQDDKGRYISDADHLIFLPKGCSYSVTFAIPGECLLVEFDSATPECGILSLPLSSTVKNHLLRLEKIWFYKKPAYLPHTLRALYDTFITLHAHASYASSDQCRLIEKSLLHLESYYSNSDLRIEDLAKIAGISSVYFRRVFQAIYHVTPIHYLRTIRIEKAKSLLAAEFGSIEEVAFAVGFSSVHYFSKTFRQLTGQTPSSFAQQRY